MKNDTIETDDVAWLLGEILCFLEKKLSKRKKERFANMSGKNIAHVCALLYTTYFVNQKETGRKTIL